MAKISQSKRKSGESYERLFGNASLGLLFSKVQSTVIRSGFELEKLLQQVVPLEMQTTLEALAVESSDKRPDVQVVFKPAKPDPDNPSKFIQADLLIADNVNRRFSLIEIKEGHLFDTKKADGELFSLKNITSWLAQEFAYRTHYYLCAFNYENKDAIVLGLKRRFPINHVMTGRELCEALNLDYDYVRGLRNEDQADNRQYFLRELLAIPEIREEVRELLGEYDDE